MVYLLHFEEPYHHARHYLAGQTTWKPGWQNIAAGAARA